MCDAGPQTPNATYEVLVSSAGNKHHHHAIMHTAIIPVTLQLSICRTYLGSCLQDLGNGKTGGKAACV